MKLVRGVSFLLAGIYPQRLVAPSVVVISDSNMSLSASSEDSTSVNVNNGITTNEAVWMKEGDTTEDENSITINAE